MRRQAQFAIVDQTPFAVIIRDIGPWDRQMTVTNDAENVVHRLAPVLDGRRLFYFDSEGEFSELKVTDGKFAGFAFPFRYLSKDLVTEERIARESSKRQAPGPLLVEVQSQKARRQFRKLFPK